LVSYKKKLITTGLLAAHTTNTSLPERYILAVTSSIAIQVAYGVYTPSVKNT